MSAFACQIDETMMGEEIVTPVLPRLKAPKKKSIEYGPAPKHMIEAVRRELRRLVELPDLDAQLGTIGRFANQSDDMLMCLKAPMAVMRAEHEITVPGTQDTPGNIETIGANFIRQIMAGLSAHQSTSLQSPELLVNAVAAARREGMEDLAKELEKKLVGKPLAGARPVLGKRPTIEDYVAPEPRRRRGSKGARLTDTPVRADGHPVLPPHGLNGSAP